MRQKRAYAEIHPRYINGRSRNEPIPMDPGELEAMSTVLQTRRRTDGLTGKERREAYVRERRKIHDVERNDGDPV